MMVAEETNNLYNNNVLPINNYSNLSGDKSDSIFNKYKFDEENRINLNDTILESHDGDDYMNEILNKYIDKMDRDQSDLREDIRQSNRDNNEMIKSSEERITKLIESIIETNQSLEDKIDTNNKYIISISLTTILAIAAMVISLLIQ